MESGSRRSPRGVATRPGGRFVSPHLRPAAAQHPVVPSEVLKPDGSVDDEATADLLEIALPVTLSRQQILEEDLSSALLQFRRRATQLGQLEDWFIFNGTYPSIELTANGQLSLKRRRRRASATTAQLLPYLNDLGPQSNGPV